MARELRRTSTPVADLASIQAAILHLRNARFCLSDAGAERAADKVRSALKSAEGAERHALRLAAPFYEEAVRRLEGGRS